MSSPNLKTLNNEEVNDNSHEDVFDYAAQDTIDQSELNDIIDNESEEQNTSFNKCSGLKVKNLSDLDAYIFTYQKNRDEDLFNMIYKFYIPKFKYIAFKMSNEDIEQELSIALLSAINTFKEGTNAKFNTYFWTCAKNHLGVLKTHNWAKKRANNNYLTSLQQLITASDGSNTELGDLIEDYKSDMPFAEVNFTTFLETTIYPIINEDDRFIISKFIEGYTHEEISKMLRVSTQYVHTKFRRLGSKTNIRSLFMNYYNITDEQINRPRKKRIRKLMTSEIADLIASRLNYKPGGTLLTERELYQQDTIKVTANGQSTN